MCPTFFPVARAVYFQSHLFEAEAHRLDGEAGVVCHDSFIVR
jgi:hypothetical protein